jgi:hypothetical protein
VLEDGLSLWAVLCFVSLAKREYWIEVNGLTITNLQFTSDQKIYPSMKVFVIEYNKKGDILLNITLARIKT